MRSSPTRVLEVNNAVARVKRPAPDPLLPAFEPFSSPPCSKRRKSRAPSDEHENRYMYPTPVPSSSLGIFSSPPLPVSTRKPLLARSQSAFTERAPLSTLPSITLPGNGEPVLLGRSSNSSHYQLSANRLISRVHVKAQYLTAASRPKIEIQCMGWNDIKIHCQGRAWELSKGDIFTSETEDAEIMLDVQDSRVILAWPTRTCRARSDSTSTISTPTRTRVTRSPSVGWIDDNDENVDPRGNNGCTSRRLFNVSTEKRSRSSPRRGLGNSSMFRSDPQMTDTFLEIYEDEPVADFNDPEILVTLEKEGISHAAMKMLLAPSDDTDDDDELNQLLLEDQEDEGNDEEEEEEDEEEEEEEKEDEEKEEDEEDDDDGDEDGENEKDDKGAITLNFDPEPILPPMAVFSTAEPLRTPRTPPTSCTARATSPPILSSRSASISPNKDTTFRNHIVNQLAFSRLSSTPLSVLFSNIPPFLRASINMERLVQTLGSIDCIGEIKRQGKDAAGKPLETEYYYIPDNDTDIGRRAAVVEGMGRVGLRSCRKSHKQYYWKKPKKST